MKKVLALILALTMAFSLIACNSSNDPGSTNSSAPSANGSAPSASSDAKTYKFAYAFANMDENNMRTLKGLQLYIDSLNASGEYNIELIYTDAQGQMDKQISDVESLVAQKPDAIWISAVDLVGAIPCFQTAHAAGVRTIDGRGCVDESVDHHITGFNEDVIGGLLQQAIRDYLDANPDMVLKVGGIYGMASQSNQLKRVDFPLALAEEMPDRIQILETQYCDWSTDRATSTMEDWMQRYPEMNAIFTASDDMGLGVYNALTAQGKENILITAVDGTKIGVQLATEAKQRYTTIGANQEQITRHMVDFMIMVADDAYDEYEYACPPECFVLVTPETVATADFGDV